MTSLLAHHSVVKIIRYYRNQIESPASHQFCQLVLRITAAISGADEDAHGRMRSDRCRSNTTREESAVVVFPVFSVIHIFLLVAVVGFV